jgi:hypothetical protein
MSEHEPTYPASTSLVPLKHAIEQDQVSDIHRFLSALPQDTANEWFRLAGDKFGFPTAEIEGIRYGLSRDLSTKIYGHHSGHLGELLRRYNENVLSLRGFTFNGITLLREAFSLHHADYVSTFLTYRQFLIVGLKGETPFAKEIQLYLLRMEEEARIALASEKKTGLTPRQLQTMAIQVNTKLDAYEHAGRLLNVICQIDAVFGIPKHLSLIEAVKEVKADTGLDFSEKLLRSPHMDALPAAEEFLEIAELTARYHLRRGTLNRWLETRGYQERQGNGYVMTPKADQSGVAHRHAWAKGNKNGYNLAWRTTFIDTIMEQVRAFEVMI